MHFNTVFIKIGQCFIAPNQTSKSKCEIVWSSIIEPGYAQHNWLHIDLISIKMYQWKIETNFSFNISATTYHFNALIQTMIIILYYFHSELLWTAPEILRNPLLLQQRGDSKRKLMCIALLLLCRKLFWETAHSACWN